MAGISFTFKEGQPPNQTDVTVKIEQADAKDKRKLKIKVTKTEKGKQVDYPYDVTDAKLIPPKPLPDPPPKVLPPRDTVLEGKGFGITVTCPQNADDKINRPKISLGPGSALVSAPITEAEQARIIEELTKLGLPAK